MRQYEQEMIELFSAPRTRRLFENIELAEIDRSVKISMNPPLES